MKTTIIQVPVSKDLRIQATKAATKSGFSSIQETIRLFLTKLATNRIEANFEPVPIILSTKNDKRYGKMIKEMENGKVKPLIAKNVKDLMRQLHGKNN